MEVNSWDLDQKPADQDLHGFQKRAQNAPCMLLALNTVAFWGISLEPDMYISHCLQIEEALLERKKRELLQKYTSDSLQAEEDESKELMGLWHH